MTPIHLIVFERQATLIDTSLPQKGDQQMLEVARLRTGIHIFRLLVGPGSPFTVRYA